MKLKVGDVVKLNKVIKSIHRCDDWKTGFYQVKTITHRVGTMLCDQHKPERQAYHFVKVKKDGSPMKATKTYGYAVIEFDSMIENGDVDVVT